MTYGVYETTYGNAAMYTGGKTAFDLDAGERIPLSEVRADRYIRPVCQEDRLQRYTANKVRA